MSVGYNIRRLRESKGISQAQLAKDVGITASMLCQIEKDYKMPSTPVGAEIARRLGCSVESLVYNTPDNAEELKDTTQ